MTPMQEKVLGYMKTRKGPVSADKIAKYFICSQSAASAALAWLHEQGHLELKKQGSKKLYQGKP